MTLMILGIDPGRRRYGVAVADPETRFARPVEIIDAALADPVDRIAELARDLGVSTIVVGRPVSLSGAAGPAVLLSDRLAAALQERLGETEIVQFDERFTTVIAEDARRSAGTRAKKRGAVDAVAAQLMLQTYLDASTTS